MDRMRHVHKVTGANGRTYLYLRKAGLPRLELRSPWPAPGEDPADCALAREVAALVAGLTPPAALPGTLGELCRYYELKDAGFLALADSTKAEYRRYLAEFVDDLGDVAAAGFTPAFVKQLVDAWARRGHRAANLRRQLLKNVLRKALIDGTLAADPFGVVAGVPRPASLGEPHVLWPDPVVDALIAAALRRRRFGLVRAIALVRWAGPRRGDLVRLTAGARQLQRTRAGEERRLRFLSGKRRVPVDIAEEPELTRWLDATPRTQPDEPRQGRKGAPTAAGAGAGAAARLTPHLVYNLAGAPYTEDGLGEELAKLVVAEFKAGRIPSDRYDLHGLRHTRGVELALAGCTDAEGAAQLGHASPSSFAQYRRQADRIRLADNGARKVRQLRERQG